MDSALSIVIPVYNSELSLTPLVERLEAVLQSMQLPGYELIFINDASRDSSWSVVEKLVASRPWIRGINLMRNYGQHNALLCGIRAARFPIIVTMDDDLQHPPEEIPKLLAAMTDKIDVVYGTPEQERHGFLRNILSVGTKWIWSQVFGAKIARMLSAFRAIRTQCRTGFDQYHGTFVSIDVLLSWVTTRVTSVKVKRNPRTIGKSTYTLRKLITHTINITLSFSSLPLRFASLLGALFLLFGFVLLVFVIVRYFTEGTSVPGFPFLASIVTIFSGAQMFALGIIGEYLARVFNWTLQKPAYAVREQIDQAQAEIDVNRLPAKGS